MSSDRLNVIALISGGKDSFFTQLHCIEHGHSIVALANLFPDTGLTTNEEAESRDLGDEAASPKPQLLNDALDSPAETPHLPPKTQLYDPAVWAPSLAHHHQQHHPHRGQTCQSRDDVGESSETDLNSFMYQTVGHEILPLYAAATGLPLYRQPIGGRAVRHERDYDSTAATKSTHHEDHDDEDETESMLPLLRAIMARHPEANALCAGAILSTYQRTRVESIAMRLGLTPLAFLWQYPVLPHPSPAATKSGASETQLLSDMAAAGLEARIIKVASAGLDETHLWERVSSEEGALRVRNALRKFGASEGAAALGEGGEFETIVLDGPAQLFRKRITVSDQGRKIVREGGGCSWLALRGAQLEEKPDLDRICSVRTPDLLDPRFKAILEALSSGPLTLTDPVEFGLGRGSSLLAAGASVASSADDDLLRWSVLAKPISGERSIQEETILVVDKIKDLLSSASLEASQITNTIIALRRMADFPKVNAEYGKLFPKPNPPSRVTISCGDLLPDGCNIAIYLTVPSSQVKVDRNGLHVQSRSYWAPANIGPYSQAIDIPITAKHVDTGLRSIAIAGQIPLIPATMVLPTPSETSHQLQIVLSLQHLWRVAVELKIQYWTSAVAYFPRSSSSDMAQNAKLAGLAWRQAFGPPEEDEEADDAVDVWDLKHNPAYASLAGNDQQETQRSLPDWSTLTLRQQNEPDACVPPMFAVEVEELPRQSAVEWHAHNGLSRVGDSSVEMAFFPEVGVPGWKAWNFIVRGSNATMVYTTLASCLEQQSGSMKLEELEDATRTAYQESLRRLKSDVTNSAPPKPYLTYVDANNVDTPWALTVESTSGVAMIPCQSIWSSQGERLRYIALYETTFHA